MATHVERQEHELPIQVIRPSSGWQQLGLAELWRYRELLGFLTWRNVLVRYKQTALGLSWAFLQPLVFLTTLTLVASRASIPNNGVPRPLFFLAGLVPWLFFSTSMAQASNSLV